MKSSICFFSLSGDLPQNLFKSSNDNFNVHQSRIFNLQLNKNDRSFTFARANGVVVVANSRIDNQAELIKKYNINLNATDADLVLSLHVRNQLDLNEIHGVFSLIIYEEISKKIIAATDHAQLHPIFYFKKNNFIVFSNSVQKIKKEFQNEIYIDNDVVTDYLVSGHPRNGRTIYKNLNPIKESTIKIFQNDKEETKTYFKFEKNNSLNLNLEDSINGVEDIFFKILSEQLSRSNKKIGFTLSGGLDSSSILCSIDFLNRKHSLGKKLNSASATFPRISKDEYPFADETNEIKDLINKTSTSGKLFDFFDEGSFGISTIVAKTDEPIISPNIYLHENFFEYFKSKSIYDVFEGLGGDTTISHGTGYFLDLAKKGKYLSLIKQYGLLRKTRKKNADYFDLIKRFLILRNLPYGLQKFLFGLRESGKQNYFNINLFLRKKNHINISEHFELLHGYHPYAIPKNVDPEVEAHNSIFRPYSCRSGYHYAQSKGIKSFLPYLDKRLINYCINVPLQAKMKDGITRYYFREAMKKHLPLSVYSKQTKSDVGGVFDMELRKYSKSKLQNSLFSGDSYLIDIMDKGKIQEYLSMGDFSNGQVSTNLYKLFVLNNWLKENA